MLKIFFFNAAFLFVCFLSMSFAFAEAPKLHIGLRESEEAALKFSPALMVSNLDMNAALHKADSQYSNLWPKLSLDGSYRYVSEVASISIPTTTGIRSMALGDNTNYSIGPALNWNIWDSGATYKGWRSFEALAVAKQEEFRARKQQILLATRLSYFNVQLALEKVRLLADSLQLSQAQYRDIETRLRAGASSRLDAYSAHQQVLVYLLQFRQARSDLASSLRDLFALTGQNKDVDVSLPLYAEDKEIYQDYEPATVFLSMDPLENSFGAIKPVDFNKDNSAAKNPQTLAMNQMAQASRLAAESASSAHWPKIQLMAKTSWDYPNGPVLERFHQNTVGVAATLPLFEAGKITHDVAEKNAQADANERRRDQIQSDIMRDWQKSSDQLKGFIAQREINKKSVFETEELAKLTYTSYKNGRSSLLEVQSTNLRALEAKVQTVRTEVQILMQFAIMASLSGEEVAK